MVDEKCELLFKSRRFGDTLLQAIENAFFFLPRFTGYVHSGRRAVIKCTFFVKVR